MDEYKDKIKKQMDRPKRSAREELMGGAESKPEITPEPIQEQQEMYTITIPQFVLKLADPEQTFGTKAPVKSELIGCFFEPSVAKAFKKDQKAKGRGWQSHLVNELVKQYYKQKGLL